MSSNDSLWSQTIAYLRFPLTGGVVFIHFNLSSGFEVLGTTFCKDAPAWFYFIVNLLSNVIASIGVPCFFVISGFLFFYNINKSFSLEVYTKKLKSRAKSLLIPFLLWNIIAMFWKFRCSLPWLSSYYTQSEIQISLTRIINTIFCFGYTNGIFVYPTLAGSPSAFQPIDGPLWFVRELMLLIIISPLLFKLLKFLRFYLVLCLGVIWLFSNVFFPVEGYNVNIITAAFFFSWGAYYSIKNENLVDSLQKYRYLSALYPMIAIADTYFYMNGYNDYLHKVGVVMGIIAVVNCTSFLINSGKVKVNYTLANSSFFIFALHDLFIHDLGKSVFIFAHIPGSNPYVMILFYLIVPILTIIICLSLYKLLKSNLPALCNLLSGGR